MHQLQDDRENYLRICVSCAQGTNKITKLNYSSVWVMAFAVTLLVCWFESL